ncbi:MAG: hypothetical protein ACR2MW_02145 [Chthoniobacterales bacterium]
MQSFSPRAGQDDDPEMAKALKTAAADPALARWLEEEQAFDQAVAQHLAAIPAPFGLRTRILAQAEDVQHTSKLRWAFRIAATVALLLLFAQGVSFWRASQRGSDLPSEYAREMASFIQLPPPLQMESDNLGQIRNWLAEKNAAPVKVPARLAALAPLGCRVLSFRGQQVSLICFEREGKQLAHLFVVDRAALPKLEADAGPTFANEHGWMTATWVEGGRVYMIAMQGGRAEIEEFLPRKA